MRDLFDEVAGKSPLDPNEAVRRTSRAQLPKRFYKQASVTEEDGGFAVRLDGRAVKTPSRNALAAPDPVLAEAIAAEWQAQGETIDPSMMPLTRLANSVIDGVAGRIEAVTDDIAKYFASDLLFYRAEHPEELIAREAEHWDPVLYWAAEAFGAHFILAQGIIHAVQPDTAIAAARAALPQGPWSIGALHVVTTITGSALLALALAHGRLDADQVWAAAHVDEDWNIEQWGLDEEVAARRAAKQAEFTAAARVIAALGSRRS
ncbi:chaperone required for assembly of F1-ATPase [Rhodopseudomonas thermotolerans]|uniref:Chaperone required for assembly of F1-ATPase n=2 Tax=Rhodopseudomonas TaxID=1073 RepID=A0A336JTV8_9BRAD|nr:MULTISPECIES: ATP12 family protein [Rhodopseudomonas]RED32684.1 chaperone required for assembly of F1-ATPase [Rhodopseudomonas pentothenatexigens]REF93693.1 chaperone required for assembly of F1-ATPase [Rhodopseudomonas thermotolerans]SSW91579.1 chaperone required for assembly of F1-ATPase [Rhodopseudomonas pentothenatexigens]